MATKKMDIHQALMQAINDKCLLIQEDIGKNLISQYGMKIPRGLTADRAR